MEAFLFLAFTLFNLLPLLSGTYFPTLDGPAHLYNAKIIQQLLTNHPSVFDDFFAYNPELVPNWTSHVLLVLLSKIMPLYLAEKVILVGFLIALPYAFRYFIKTITKGASYLSFLIFPFTYSYFFFLGFYNFSISLVFLFILLAFWIKNYEKTNHLKQFLFLSLGIAIMYFSHIFVFAVLLLSMGIYVIAKGIQSLMLKEQTTKKVIVFSFIKAGILLASSLFPLMLFVDYFLDRQHVGGEVFLSHQELIDGLTQIRLLITLNLEIESIQTKRVFLALVALILLTIAVRVWGKYQSSNYEKKPSVLLRVFRLNDAWLLVSFCMLLLYFILPDANADAGYVSPRLALLFFLFLIVWIATHAIPKWIGVPIVLLLLVVQFKRVNYFRESIKVIDPFVVEYVKVSELIDENAVVLPINQTNNWLFGHFSNYLGLSKPMILLENYECDQTYFPLVWNRDKIPTPLLGTAHLDQFPKLDWKNPSNPNTLPIDYVFYMGNLKDSLMPLQADLDSIIRKHYKLSYYSNKCSLFELKKTK